MSFIDRDSLTIVTRKSRIKKINVNLVATVKMYLFAQEGKSNPTVTPILGQFKINSMEFFKKFNLLSLMYSLGIPLNIKIYKLMNDTVEIILKIVSIYMLLWIYNEEKNIKFFINKILLYDLIRIEAKKLNLTLELTSKIIFGILKSYKIKKII